MSGEQADCVLLPSLVGGTKLVLLTRLEDGKTQIWLNLKNNYQGPKIARLSMVRPVSDYTLFLFDK